MGQCTRAARMDAELQNSQTITKTDETELPLMSKDDVADRILDKGMEIIGNLC